MSAMIKRRDGTMTEQLSCTVIRNCKYGTYTYTRVYYLDYAVDVSTGMIDESELKECCTKDQLKTNIDELLKAYRALKAKK